MPELDIEQLERFMSIVYEGTESYGLPNICYRDTDAPLTNAGTSPWKSIWSQEDWEFYSGPLSKYDSYASMYLR